MSSPEELIEQLVAADGISDSLPGQLLVAFSRGFPVSNLEPLLRHPSRSVVMTAGYILSELGERGADLESICVELLSNPLEDIRSDSISNILANSAQYNPSTVWAVISRYPVETDWIKEDIVNFLARAPLAVLRAAVTSASDEGVPKHASGLELHMPSSVGPPILSALQSQDALTRAYALSAARRLELFVNSAWRTAKRSADAVLRKSGERWLRSG